MAEREISLLPKEKWEGTVIGRLMNWVFSVGRYIIIFTELIVVGAFISRFWLDRTNSDLSEEVRQQEAILASTSDFEKEFTLFQSRLKTIATALKEPSDPLLSLELIVDSLPADAVLVKYGFSGGEKNEASVLALIFSESSLVEFVDNLLSESEVSSVRIGTIERSQGMAGMKIQFLISFRRPGANEKTDNS